MEFIEAMPDIRRRCPKILMGNDAGRPRIVDQHVEPAKVDDHLVDEHLPRCFIQQISLKIPGTGQSGGCL